MHELTDDDGVSSQTGDARVDEALRRLDRLDELPVREHAGVVEGVHRALQDRLTGDGEQAAEDDDQPADDGWEG